MFSPCPVSSVGARSGRLHSPHIGARLPRRCVKRQVEERFERLAWWVEKCLLNIRYLEACFRALFRFGNQGFTAEIALTRTKCVQAISATMFSPVPFAPLRTKQACCGAVSGIARSKIKSLARKALAIPWIAPLLLRKLRRNSAQKNIPGLALAPVGRSANPLLNYRFVFINLNRHSPRTNKLLILLLVYQRIIFKFYRISLKLHGLITVLNNPNLFFY